MNITELITLTEARIFYLDTLRIAAESVGDIPQLNTLYPSIYEAQETLTKLRSIA